MREYSKATGRERVIVQKGTRLGNWHRNCGEEHSRTVAWQPQAFTTVVPMCQITKRSLLGKTVFQR